jgi:hypothetical protein
LRNAFIIFSAEICAATDAQRWPGFPDLWTNHCFESFDAMSGRLALPWYALLPASLPDIVRYQRSFPDSKDRRLETDFSNIPQSAVDKELPGAENQTHI